MAQALLSLATPTPAAAAKSLCPNSPVKAKPQGLFSSFSFSQRLSSLHSFSSSFLQQKLEKERFLGFPIYCSSSVDFQHARVVYPRPAEIPWKKELCNSVHLIGIVGSPIQIKHLSSGKVLASSRLAVKKSATDTVWVSLTFWDELAHVAFQYVEKGQQIYVSGRLVSNTVEGDDEKRQTYYKVVVQQLNFVERTFPPVPLYEPETNSMITGGKAGNFSGNHVGSTVELWQAFFANPVDWWDNRKNKRNPKYPDFKHKHTGEALWIEAKYNPQWVKSQLAILDSRMESLRDNNSSKSVAFMSGDDLAPF